MINNMFGECHSLSILPDISKWTLSKVVDMSSLFYNCFSLISLPDISKWRLSNVDDISYIFYGCLSLTSIPEISRWEKIKYGRHLFSDCISLISISYPYISRY